MVEGARRFFPRNVRAYNDRRSHIIIDDAKTVFSTYNRLYDIIVSEPSNPWVSGTAALFSVEFYRIAQRHLAPGGVFVQWLQLYEFDVDLVASVLKALGDSFDDYAIYSGAPGDILIVSVNGRSVPGPQIDFGINPQLSAALRRVNIRTVQDVVGRKLADKHLLQPWLAAAPLPANSDYWPVLDYRANRARFLNTSARSIEELGFEPLPILDLLGAAAHPALTTDVSFVPTSPLAPHFAAMRIRDRLLAKEIGAAQPAPLQGDRRSVLEADALLDQCRMSSTRAQLASARFQLGSHLARFLTAPELEIVWPRLESLPCFGGLTEVERSWLRLFKAIGQRRPGEMADAAELLLAVESPSSERRAYLVGAALLGHLGAGHREAARTLWRKEPLQVVGSKSFAIAVLAAHVAQQFPALR